MNRGTEALIGFMAGVLAGGVAALLLAPEKGRVTRRKIRRTTGDFYDKSRDWVDGTSGMIRDRAEDVAGKARETFSR